MVVLNSFNYGTSDMTKQSKKAELQGKVDEFKEQLEETLKPLATVVDGQAPTLPFMPYDNEHWAEPFSASLMERSNGLAQKIWNGKEGYDAQRYYFPGVSGDTEVAALIEKNKEYFDNLKVNTALRRLFAYNLAHADPNGYCDTLRVNDLIKKLKRLEKKHVLDDLIDDNARESIVNNILVPSHMYGIHDQYYHPSLSLRYPSQKAVVNDLLSQQDMDTMESVISYIPRIRMLQATFRGSSGYPVKSERLLAKWMPEPNTYSSLDDDRQFLFDLANFANFFNCALPYTVATDLVANLKYPTASGQSLEKLRTASSALRDVAIGYIQEKKQLSDLLEAISSLVEALQQYFSSVATEVESCFNFISRIGMTFDKLVEESKQRIDGSGCPF